jgi:Skp family chaperone for outer membrane proteins
LASKYPKLQVLATLDRGYLIVTPSDPMQIYKAQQNPQYQNCIRELKNDQLVTNLQEKISQIDAIFSARQKHDRLVQEKVTAKIAVIVSNYAEKNNFDLILLNSSNNIIYNKSKITLDITEAVLNSTIVTK